MKRIEREREREREGRERERERERVRTRESGRGREGGREGERRNERERENERERDNERGRGRGREAQAAHTANVATKEMWALQPPQRCVGCMQRCVYRPIFGNLLQEREESPVRELLRHELCATLLHVCTAQALYSSLTLSFPPSRILTHPMTLSSSQRCHADGLAYTAAISRYTLGTCTCPYQPEAITALPCH